MESELDTTAPSQSRRSLRQLQKVLLSTFVLSAVSLALAVFITLAGR